MDTTTAKHSTDIKMAAHAFCQKYNLSDEKEAVIASTTPKTLLYAVPGSGKTTVVVSKARFLIELGLAKASEIVILTFTRAAAKDMMGKYVTMFHPSDEEERPEFRTIHSFCLTKILPMLRNQGFLFNSKILDSGISKGSKENGITVFTPQMVIKEVLRGMKVRDYYDEDIQDEALNAITYIKNRMLSKEEYEEKIVALGVDGINAGVLFEKYTNLLSQIGYIDFDDVLIETLKGLRQHPEVIDTIRATFSYWFVDEAQDNSPLQNAILELLTSEKTNIMMVGDDDQSIYAFRGASPDLLLRFGEQNGVATFTLKENRRSDKAIVEGAKKFISRNHNRKKKDMISLSRNEGTIKCIDDLVHEWAQYRYILDVAKESREAGTKVGILSRTNKSQLPLLFLFLKKGVPVKVTKNPTALFDHGLFGKLYCICDFAFNPTSYEKFKKARFPMRLYYGKETESELEKLVNENPDEKILDLLIKARLSLGKKIESVVKAYKNLEKIKEGSICDSLDFILKEYLPGFKILSVGNMIEFRSAVSSFLICKTFEEFFELSEKILSDANSTEKSGKIITPGPSVTVSTIHSAKGLEYDRVIVIDGIESVAVGNKKNGKNMLFEQDSEEERRLLYVACTRAKHELDFVFDEIQINRRFIVNEHISQFLSCCESVLKSDLIASKCKPVVSNNGLEKCIQIPNQKFYYAVKIGRTPGIYTSWGECEKQIKGFSCAVYKKFNNEKEAMNYLERK